MNEVIINLADESKKLSACELLQSINSESPQKHHASDIHTDKDGNYIAVTCDCGVCHPIFIAPKLDVCWILTVSSEELSSFTKEGERMWVL